MCSWTLRDVNHQVLHECLEWIPSAAEALTHVISQGVSLKGADLVHFVRQWGHPHQSLSHMDFTDVDLSECHAAHVEFSHSDFTRAQLRSANLRDCVMRECVATSHLV